MSYQHKEKLRILRELRKSGLSVVAFAAQSGIPERTIFRWKKDCRDPGGSLPEKPDGIKLKGERRITIDEQTWRWLKAMSVLDGEREIGEIVRDLVLKEVKDAGFTGST